MSLKFDPDDSLLNASWATVLLSERDVAGQIPINFVTTSAISLRAACFGDNKFGRTAAGKCLSNLLAIGYRRFNVDLYWSPDHSRWILCPVSIPKGLHVATTTPDASPTATAEVAQGTVAVESDESTGDILYDLGPYKCSDGLDLVDVLDIFHDYFQYTDTDLVMYTRYLSFNLHAAADPASAGSPASFVDSGQLPAKPDRVSSILEEQIGSYIYGPLDLSKDRRNLNESWYEVDETYKPIVQYFTIERDSGGVQSTPDGWPSMKYIQLAAEKRLLIEYGSIDPQLSSYDLSQENDVIFPPGYMTSTVPVSAGDDGSLDTGCLYNPNTTDVSKVNASWAIANHIPIPQSLSDQSLLNVSDLIVNLTQCGMTATLNQTLFGLTADDNPDPYRNLTLSSSWAWALGQPAARPSNLDAAESDDKRCAVMDLTLDGRWRTENCSETHRAACRIDNQPFRWALSTNAFTYDDAYDDACPSPREFSVPRTGLENTYLFRHLLSLSPELIDPASSDPLKREVWIDFNSIDTETCWVTGGSEAKCPYTSDPDQLERRTVLVAAIAGIVICIIAALTLFVKCNANRRNSRRNKRVIQGWEYEGVPS
ncbi:hypothetical protein ASPSYDRAFT_89695 [Aspergillus sydowii CBS 593.65]|uniref:Maintenance of telomere capping protein 6 n=1 Tax=Aspergillus sydowii CBS 593.65 TaxID=1036612 RepID=A0A1L9TI47_9EURO|nr:uncharacterized protein ASPSYDRAFT_89695 [Aspergillus sydowii CBS 593.65]OJJ58973.1 hypothetical protein ASPSYDRAFT_89695 [Aspergillus sydowii CBS 593.65]